MSSIFTQNAAMFGAAIKAGFLSDKDILELFKMTYDEYSGSSCFDRFGECVRLFNQKRPEQFAQFAKDLMAKYDLPEVREAFKQMTQPSDGVVNLSSVWMKKLEERNLPFNFIIVFIEYTSRHMKGKNLLVTLEARGRESLMFADLMSGKGLQA